ncbi:arginase [Paenibacillus sp. OV219]|uniref:arginase n=1 Tax=Paenibacillus sp. OV219 TaxID=1884377 RepID=UPI0008D6019D|nr:arginase [Paenibacillus sp. OV219]SEM89070.1 arginase [Paenibacillus sp. OV219]
MTESTNSANRTKKLSLIHVPFGLGAGRPGTEEGPESMVQIGLMRQLRKTAFEVASEHKVKVPSHPAATTGDHIGGVKHLAEVKEMGALVAEQVSLAASKGHLPLVLGGDHSVTIGALAGMAAQVGKLGVIYFDAHPGLQTEESHPISRMGSMSLSVALGKAKLKLAELNRDVRENAIDKANVVLIGVRDVEPEERAIIKAEGITVFSMHEIDRMGIEKVISKAVEVAGNGTDGIHVSFSADCLDPIEAPGVDMQVPGGLTYREAHFACELLAETGLIRSIDVVEVNSKLDESRRTARLAIGLIASLLGKRIL